MARKQVLEKYLCILLNSQCYGGKARNELQVETKVLGMWTLKHAAPSVLDCFSTVNYMCFCEQ